MDPAWIGLGGTVVGGLIATGGAMALQRRKEKAEVSQRVVEAVTLIGNVRVTAFEWIYCLRYVTKTAAAGRFVELPWFDEVSAELRKQVHQAMAAVGHLGPEDLFYSRFAESLRSMEAEVRGIIANRSQDQAHEVLLRTESFAVLFSVRREVTTAMINDVLKGRWITPND
ncbi:hypothetical protein [Streptomyces sp. NPDC050738]|uniref:hypothetical protein n=1 Tax=Streptomyces sp. NPDC050738 TaxID=3154744 RepID=UPI0034232C61